MPINFYGRYEGDRIVAVMATRRVGRTPQDSPRANGWVAITQKTYQDALRAGLRNAAPEWEQFKG